MIESSSSYVLLQLFVLNRPPLSLSSASRERLPSCFLVAITYLVCLEITLQIVARFHSACVFVSVDNNNK